MKWYILMLILFYLAGCEATSVPSTTVSSPLIPSRAGPTSATSVPVPLTPSPSINAGIPNSKPSGTPSPTVATAMPTNDNGVHFVIAVRGSLDLKRQGWTTYAPARFGTIVRYGDLLRLADTAEAMIVCADLTLANVPKGISAVPCRVPKSILSYRDDHLSGTRGAGIAEYPIVISPRMTNLLGAHPILRWMPPITGGITYTVSVRGSGMEWTTQVISKTELAYPNDAPSLIPGQPYKLTVEVNGRSSDEDPAPFLGFTILPADQIQTLLEEEQKISALGLGTAPKEYLIAQLYKKYSLIADAIEKIEALSPTASEPAIVRTLGDLYLKIGLVDLAKPHYDRAWQLSSGLNDLEGEALAEYGLGLVYDSLGNKNESVRWFQEANSHYEALGDSIKIQEIKGLIK